MIWIVTYGNSEGQWTAYFATETAAEMWTAHWTQTYEEYPGFVCEVHEEWLTTEDDLCEDEGCPTLTLYRPQAV